MRITTLIATLALNSLCLAETWTVDLNGGADFTTIQAAIDAASDGDTIKVVPSGLYGTSGDVVANVTNKALTIESATPGVKAVVFGDHVAAGFVCTPAEGNLQTLRDLLFLDCRSLTSGGGVSASGHIVLEHCSFYECSASNLGGGLFSTGTVEVNHCYFNLCFAQYGGGGAAISNGATLSAWSGTFSDNWTSGMYGNGGAIYCDGASSMSLTAIEFQRNIASSGGAIYMDGGMLDCVSLIAYDNTAFNDGGGLYLWNTTASIQGQILNNTAGNTGGGISASYCSLDFLNTSINANRAAWGGGIDLMAGDASFQSSCFNMNSAGFFGGGIWNDNSLLLVDGCSFGDNTAFGGSVIRSANDNDAAHTTFKNSVACNNGNPIIQGLWTDGGGNDLFGCGGEEGSPEPSPEGDLDNDGALDGADMGVLLAQWGSADTGDLNHDGTVDGADFGILLANWGN